MSVTDEARFHVGDHVLYQLLDGPIEVEVLEELGPAGFNGRHMVRIRLQMPYTEPVELDVAEARLRPVSDAA